MLREVQQGSLDRGIAALRNTCDASVRKGKLDAAQRDVRMALVQGARSPMTTWPAWAACASPAGR